MSAHDNFGLCVQTLIVSAVASPQYYACDGAGYYVEQVGVKEREDTKTSPKEKEKFEVEWRVLLHNDDVHTFDYVSRQLADVRHSFLIELALPSRLGKSLESESCGGFCFCSSG
jgi:hypothetical protein